MTDEDTIQMGLRVPKSLRDALDRLATLEHRSLNAVAIIAFEDLLAKRLRGYAFEDDKVHIDGRRDVAFTWLHNTVDDSDRHRVRVEVTREYVADEWGVRWSNEAAVKKEFLKRRADYIEPASRAPSTGGTHRVFVIGE